MRCRAKRTRNATSLSLFLSARQHAEPCPVVHCFAIKQREHYKNMKTIKKFLGDESGMETLEYAVVAGLIALAAVFVYLNSNWKTTLVNRLNDAATQS